MKIIFDIDEPTERGTTVAAFDYAFHGKALLGFDPIIIYKEQSNQNEKVLRKFSSHFQIAGYKNEVSKQILVKSLQADVYYRLIIKANDDYRLPGILNAAHLVFDYTKPTGHLNAYVSEWLARHASGPAIPSVPHIVKLPVADGDMRAELGISADATVVGRYGGFSQFDIPFVQATVIDTVKSRKDIVFLFANTANFFQHPQIIYLPPIYEDSDKSRFIKTCDIMLHGRYSGESFGLAMAEFLHLNRPVLCWAGGWDRNHIVMQPNKHHIYHTRHDLSKLLHKSKPIHQYIFDSKIAVEQFSPENVLKRFNEVFLCEPTPICREQTISYFYLNRRRISNRIQRAKSWLYDKA